MKRLVIIRFFFLPFLAINGQLHADPAEGRTVQAVDSGTIVSKGEQIAKLLYESFDGMSEDISKQIELLGWCISPIQIMNDSQSLYIASVLKGLVENDEIKKLPELYLNALTFVCSWLQSQDTQAKNAAVRVFLTLQELTWDAWGHNHAQELVAFGNSLSKALDEVSNVTKEQREWLKALMARIDNQFPHEKQFSRDAKAWNDIVPNLCNQQNAPNAQQDVLHGIAFCINVHGRREPALKDAANIVWSKVIEAISRLINESPETTTVPSQGNKMTQSTKTSNVGRNVKVQKSSRKVNRR
ncbi:MAG: hypothetical protein LBJ89_04015 [Holosporales bacterium]|jgi:hypothetical protein|nr:hypothetical protein [Holosporales bacterium]